MAVSKVYVDSSVIDSVEHDSAEDAVFVHFHNGSTARYYNIDKELFLEFVGAESPGNFYNRYIKSRPTTKPNRVRPGDRVRLTHAVVNGTAQVVEVLGDNVAVKVFVSKDSVRKV